MIIELLDQTDNLRERLRFIQWAKANWDTEMPIDRILPRKERLRWAYLFLAKHQGFDMEAFETETIRELATRGVVSS